MSELIAVIIIGAAIGVHIAWLLYNFETIISKLIELNKKIEKNNKLLDKLVGEDNGG